MTNKHSFTWRKGIVLSATFLFIALVSVSCKKKENQIGLNAIDQNDLLASGGVDTFSLITYSFVEDSTLTKNNVVTLLGSYNDPTFGPVNAEIFTQLHIQAPNPNFGDLSTIAIDSFVLGLVYSGYFGKTGNQTIEVFEIDPSNEINKDSNYYANSTLLSGSTNWVAPGASVVNMNSENITIINESEVPSQLRIHLDTNKARSIIEDTETMPSSFASTDAFGDYFKGLHIRTANGTQSSGQGGVFYFNLKAASSKLTIYYTQAGVKKTYDFYINAETTHFNYVNMNNSGKPIQNVINNNALGQVEYYAQAFKSRAAIEMPGIVNIPANAVVHSAVMTLPVSHQTGIEFAPAGAIAVLREDPANPGKYIGIGTAVYSSVKKNYSFDLRFHIQQIVSGELENTKLVLSPLFFNSSADRIIFNGSQTMNKMKPNLRILYTEF